MRMRAHVLPFWSDRIVPFKLAAKSVGAGSKDSTDMCCAEASEARHIRKKSARERNVIISKKNVCARRAQKPNCIWASEKVHL